MPSSGTGPRKIQTPRLEKYITADFILKYFVYFLKFFHYYFPAYTKELALATIFLPSVGFWSSGLLKDTVCFGGIGFILYAVLNIFVKKTKIRASIIWILVCGTLIYFIKVYILLVL